MFFTYNRYKQDFALHKTSFFLKVFYDKKLHFYLQPLSNNPPDVKSMIPLNWPPELDGIKVEQKTLLGRVKNTDIWVELDLQQYKGMQETLSTEMNEVIMAWIELLNL